MLQKIASAARSSRWILAGLVLVGLLVLFAVFLGGMAIFQWTESTPFCSSCHVMDPEVTVYHSSPHARVDCGTCHIGPGVLPAVQAKLASARYLYEVPLNKYPIPIPSPIQSLRPVEVVCEQCHWPQKFYEDRVFTLSDYAPDEKNSQSQVALKLKTGGGEPAAGQGRGIHWHIDNPVYYIAADDKRQDIPWVQAEYNGVTTTYQSIDSKLTAEQIASAEKRKMDCVDCHNRATHVFERPGDAIDQAMSAGLIPADLPWIKKEGTAVLEQKYATQDQGQKAVANIANTYQTQYPDVYAARKADIDKAVTELTTILNTTQFPEMSVDWQTHPNNIGHKDFPGCFRCHDGKHLSQDKQAIRLECNLCHSIPSAANPGQTLPPIPVDTTQQEPESHKSTTWLSQHRFQFDASCAGCHTIGNPGGTDNSSFCSNSACHGGNWQYVGLNAPEVRAAGQPPQTPSGAAGGPPAIPHPITPNVDCKLCHGPGKVRPFPENHASYTNDMCTGCHTPTLQDNTVQATAAPSGATPAAGATSAPTTAAPETPAAQATQPAAGGIPAIPHEIAGREKCLTCHNPKGGLKPAPQDHVGRTEDTCQGCHKPAAATQPTAAAAAAQPTAAGTEAASTTSEPTLAPTTGPAANATAAPAAAGGPPALPADHAGRTAEMCLVCHALDSTIKPMPADHAGRTGDMCLTCHKPS